MAGQRTTLTNSRRKNQAFTPLEKALDGVWDESQGDDSGSKPPVSMTVRDRSPLTGFTLIELVVVGVIISLLVFVAVPMYMNARDNIERQKAVTTLYHLCMLEKEYGMTHLDDAGLPTYVALDVFREGDTGLDGAFEDGTWRYGAAAGVDAFTITAQHVRGLLADITVDQDGQFTGLP